MKYIAISFFLFTLLMIGAACSNQLSGQVSYLGKITQHEDGTSGLTGTMAICLSHDKKHLYVGGQFSLAVFNYDEVSGNTTFVNAYRYENDGHNGLYGVSCIVMSNNDNYMYVSSDYLHCISLYERDTMNGSISLRHIFYDTDPDFDGLRGAHQMGLSTKGDYLYVAAYNDAKISTFSVDTLTGYITHRQSIGRYDDGGLSWPKILKVSNDGRFVYVLSKMDDECSIFGINAVSGELFFIEKVTSPISHVLFTAIEISHDDQFLYLAGGSSLSIYERNVFDGKLTIKEVFLSTDAGTSGMNGIYSLAVSPDDQNIYAISDGDSSFVTFSRNIEGNTFQFIESNPFLQHTYSNSDRSNTQMICESRFVFGGSYWESGVHQATRNPSDGRLAYHQFIHEGDNAVINGLYNPRSCCSDDRNKFVFVSTSGNGISVFKRNDTTGKLMYKSVANNLNQSSKLLVSNNQMAVSKDGKYLYALCQVFENSGLAILRVDQATASLVLVDSIMFDENGSTGIRDPYSLAFSPDGKHLYIVSTSGIRGIAQFRYNPQNGLLQLENSYPLQNAGSYFDQLCISQNGRYIFIWNTNSRDISMIERDVSTGELIYHSTSSLNTIGEVYLSGLKNIAVSPDNKNLYATYENSHSLVNYSIDTINNKIDVLQVFDDQSTSISGLFGIQYVEVRHDGTFVYTSSYNHNSLGLFFRDQTNGLLSFLKDYTENENGFNGLDRINGICIPYDDRNLYLISSAEEAVASYSIDLYLGPDRAICNNDSMLVDAGKGYSSYLWSTNEITQRIIIKDQGFYHVQTMDEFGFVDHDTLYLTVYQKPTLELGSEVMRCVGDSVVLNTGFSGENLWNTGDESSSITVRETGLYTVEISDQHQCKNKDSVNVVFHPLPKVDLGDDTIIGIGHTLLLSVESMPDYTYRWFDGTTEPLFWLQSSSIPNVSLEVWLEVTSNFGCKNSDSITVVVDTTQVIPENVEIRLSPVPAATSVTIESSHTIVGIDCYDIIGKYLFSEQLNSKNHILNLSELSGGVYYLKLTVSNSYTKIFKIVKQKQ